MYHPYLPKTIVKIQNSLGSVYELTPSQHKTASLTADLYHAATVRESKEAQEQLRLIFTITLEAQDAYFA